MQLSNCEGLTARCFPLKENKDMFIFEFCSPTTLGMYIINKLFDC